MGTHGVLVFAVSQRGFFSGAGRRAETVRQTTRPPARRAARQSFHLCKIPCRIPCTVDRECSSDLQSMQRNIRLVLLCVALGLVALQWRTALRLVGETQGLGTQGEGPRRLETALRCWACALRFCLGASGVRARAGPPRVRSAASCVRARAASGHTRARPALPLTVRAARRPAAGPAAGGGAPLAVDSPQLLRLVQARMQRDGLGRTVAAACVRGAGAWPGACGVCAPRARAAAPPGALTKP
jgi:hypothetical protein